MSREWKPGDLAIRTTAAHIADGYEMLTIATTCFAKDHNGGRELHWHHVGGGWDLLDVVGGPTYRPLVVIDPENREQVERLWRLIDATLDNVDSDQWAVDTVQAALRVLSEGVAQ